MEKRSLGEKISHFAVFKPWVSLFIGILILFSFLSFLIYVSIILRRTYRKTGTIILALLLALFAIGFAGAVKFSFEI